MNARITLTPADREELRHPDRARVLLVAGQAAAEAGVTLARVLGTDRSVQIARVRDVVAYRCHAGGVPQVNIAAALNVQAATVGVGIRREQSRRGETSARPTPPEGYVKEWARLPADKWGRT